MSSPISNNIYKNYGSSINTSITPKANYITNGLFKNNQINNLRLSDFAREILAHITKFCDFKSTMQFVYTCKQNHSYFMNIEESTDIDGYKEVWINHCLNLLKRDKDFINFCEDVYYKFAKLMKLGEKDLKLDCKETIFQFNKHPNVNNNPIIMLMELNKNIIELQSPWDKISFTTDFCLVFTHLICCPIFMSIWLIDYLLDDRPAKLADKYCSISYFMSIDNMIEQLKQNYPNLATTNVSFEKQKEAFMRN